MTSMYARVMCLIVCLIAAALFQLTRTPTITMIFLAEVLVLALVGFFMTEIIRLVQKTWSPAVLLRALSAVVIGFGAATFIVLCSQALYGQQILPQMVDPFVRFLLPLSITFVAFSGLQTFSFTKTRGARGDDPIADSDDNEIVQTYIPDVAALEDGRVVDLARTGIFDNQFIIPTFLAADLKFLSETGEEASRIRSKKALDALRRLEALPKINIQPRDFHIADELDLNEKIVRSAKISHSFVLTNEVTPLRPDSENYFAIDSIANALRPPIPKGEMLSIKIQRLGKEPKQGIGYLDDGTMVVVNGGGDFLGRTVRTQVLSQKYSSSGKIVFCNVREDGYDDRVGSYVVPYPQVDNAPIGHYTS